MENCFFVIDMQSHTGYGGRGSERNREKKKEKRKKTERKKERKENGKGFHQEIL